MDALNILKGEANQLAEKKKKKKTEKMMERRLTTDLACKLSKSTCPPSVTTAAATLVLPPVDQRIIRHMCVESADVWSCALDNSF